MTVRQNVKNEQNATGATHKKKMEWEMQNAVQQRKKMGLGKTSVHIGLAYLNIERNENTETRIYTELSSVCSRISIIRPFNFCMVAYYVAAESQWQQTKYRWSSIIWKLQMVWPMNLWNSLQSRALSISFNMSFYSIKCILEFLR